MSVTCRLHGSFAGDRCPVCVPAEPPGNVYLLDLRHYRLFDGEHWWEGAEALRRATTGKLRA